MKIIMTICHNIFTAISVMLPGNKFFRVHRNNMEDTMSAPMKSLEKQMESILSFCELPARRKNRKPFYSYDGNIKIRLTDYVYKKRRICISRRRRPMIIKKKCDCMRFNVSDFYDWSFNIDSLILEDNYDRAHEICNMALNFDGSDVLALVKKGDIYFEEEKFEESLFYYDKALEIEPKDFFVSIYKGNALCKLGRYDEGIECFDKVLEGDPQNTTALKRKIEVLMELERYEEALAGYDKMIENSSGRHYTLLLCGKGEIYLKQGRYEEALKVFDEAMRIEPGEIVTLEMKIDVFMEWEKYDEALKCYDEFSNVHSGHTLWCLGGKGLIYYKLKDYEKALECYEMVLEIEPDDKWALMVRDEIFYMIGR